jgi:hypothetical protein
MILGRTQQPGIIFVFLNLLDSKIIDCDEQVRIRNKMHCPSKQYNKTISFLGEQQYMQSYMLVLSHSKIWKNSNKTNILPENTFIIIFL